MLAESQYGIGQNENTRKENECPKDNDPHLNLSPVPCTYAPNTRQIQYRNTQTRGINLL